MKVTITIDGDEDGVWIAECPSIPGCVSQGNTKDETLANIREAIECCIEVRIEKGMPLTIETRQVEVLCSEGTDLRNALPDTALSAFPDAEYFDVTAERGRIVLTPVRPARAAAVRDKLADLGISDTDIAQAVAWARQG